MTRHVSKQLKTVDTVVNEYPDTAATKCGITRWTGLSAEDRKAIETIATHIQ